MRFLTRTGLSRNSLARRDESSAETDTILSRIIRNTDDLISEREEAHEDIINRVVVYTDDIIETD